MALMLRTDSVPLTKRSHRQAEPRRYSRVTKIQFVTQRAVPTLIPVRKVTAEDDSQPRQAQRSGSLREPHRGRATAKYSDTLHRLVGSQRSQRQSGGGSPRSPSPNSHPRQESRRGARHDHCTAARRVHPRHDMNKDKAASCSRTAARPTHAARPPVALNGKEEKRAARARGEGGRAAHFPATQT